MRNAAVLSSRVAPANRESRHRATRTLRCIRAVADMALLEDEDVGDAELADAFGVSGAKWSRVVADILGE